MELRRASSRKVGYLNVHTGTTTRKVPIIYGTCTYIASSSEGWSRHIVGHEESFQCIPNRELPECECDKVSELLRRALKPSADVGLPITSIVIELTSDLWSSSSLSLPWSCWALVSGMSSKAIPLFSGNVRGWPLIHRQKRTNGHANRCQNGALSA